MNVSNNIFALKPQQITKYSPLAIKLCLNTLSFADSQSLTKREKQILSKLYRNLNVLCKLNKKQIKELFKESKQFQSYQDILGQFFFDRKINNYVLINKEDSNVKNNQNVLRKQTQEKSIQTSDNLSLFPFSSCIGVEYRLEYTISNINKKKVMKPVILIMYKLSNGQDLKVYYSIQRFNQLRYLIAENMQKVYGIELRTLF